MSSFRLDLILKGGCTHAKGGSTSALNQTWNPHRNPRKTYENTAHTTDPSAATHEWNPRGTPLETPWNPTEPHGTPAKTARNPRWNPLEPPWNPRGTPGLQRHQGVCSSKKPSKTRCGRLWSSDVIPRISRWNPRGTPVALFGHQLGNRSQNPHERPHETVPACEELSMRFLGVFSSDHVDQTRTLQLRAMHFAPADSHRLTPAKPDAHHAAA